MLRCLAAALLSLVPSYGSREVAVPTQDVAAQLVPADASVLVRFQSVEALLDLARAFSPGEEAPLASLDAATLLLGMSVPGDLTAVDGTRPILLAFTHAGSTAQPGLTWVVPVTDAAKFSAALEDEDWKSVALEGYVGVSRLPDYAAGAAPSPLLARLRPGVATAHVDLAALLSALRPLVDLLLLQAESTLDSMPPDEAMPFDVQPIWEAYFEGARCVLDSAQEFGLTLERRGEELALLGDFTARPGSELDGWESSEDGELETLAACIDPDAPGQMLLSIDWPELYQRFSGFLEAALSIYPQPFRAELQQLIEAQEEIVSHLQPGMAASFELGSAGIRGLYALRSAQPDEFAAAFERLAGGFEREQGWMRLYEPGSLNVEGLEARTWRLSFDWEGMLSSIASSEDGAVEQIEAMREMFAAIYGADLRIALARKGGVILLLFGSGEEFLRSSLSRVLSAPPLGTRLQALLARTGGGTPSFAYHLDFGRLTSRVLGAMEAYRAMFPGAALEWPEVPFSVDSWGSIRGSTWSGGVGLDLEELAGFVQALRALEATSK